MQPMSTAILDQLVLSKPYFDRHGLIVAVYADRPVGFAHAGFGPNADQSDISTEIGVTSMLQISPEFDSPSLRHDLLGTVEDYLRRRGAHTLLGGEVPPYTPFYLGLYGGSNMPGVLRSDELFFSTFSRNGYHEAATYTVLNCKLSLLRLPFDRQQRQLAREFDVEPRLDHQFDTWWDACTFGATQHTSFRLIARSDRLDCGSVIVWDLEPLASSWGVHAVGLSRLHIRDARRREGLGTLLISQALKKLENAGVSLVQVQIPTDNEAANNLFFKLGFEESDHGVSFQKSVHGHSS